MDGQLEQAPAAELTSQIIPTVDEEYQPSEYELQRLERVHLNREYLASRGLEPLQAATPNKKRKWTKRPPVEKPLRSSKLQGKDKPNYKTKPTRSPRKKKQPLRISRARKYNVLLVFKHIAAQFDKFDDEGSDNEGRLGMAKCLTDMLKQYMADGCPKGACWDYATKILEQVQRTDNKSS